MKQVLRQRMQQKMTPQQIMLMKLIELPQQELEVRLKKELEENPVLEDDGRLTTESTDDNPSDDNDSSDDALNDLEDYGFEDDDMPFTPKQQSEGPQFYSLSSQHSFREDLEEQLSIRINDEKDMEIGRYLIGSLDDSGYLRRDLGSIVNDLAFTQYLEVSEDDVQRVLKELQQLDPPGIGARDLQESLLIQLKRSGRHDLIIRNAIFIVEQMFEDFTHRRYERIIERTNISDEDLKDVLHEIVSLNPKPGEPQPDMQKNARTITPDFTATVVDEEVVLQLNNGHIPTLNISPSYLDMIKSYDKSKKDKKQRETVQFIKHKVESAKWFIDAIRQREDTLMRTMHAIVDKQKAFFLTGDEKTLKPMILKDIAEVIEMDVSTVSRVVNSKFVQTPYGIFVLKKFFSEGFTKEDGEEISTTEVKQVLREVIEAEDKSRPMKDDELMELLKKKGYPMARRTVAKYREQLGIPVARLRRDL